MKVRALQDCYVDHALRFAGEVFEYNGALNPDVVDVVPDHTPEGLPPAPKGQPLLPHEMVPQKQHENRLAPGDPGEAVAPPPKPENLVGGKLAKAGDPGPVQPSK